MSKIQKSLFLLVLALVCLACGKKQSKPFPGPWSGIGYIANNFFYLEAKKEDNKMVYRYVIPVDTNKVFNAQSSIQVYFKSDSLLLNLKYGKQVKWKVSAFGGQRETSYYVEVDYPHYEYNVVFQATYIEP